MSRYINAIFQDITGLDIDARGAVMQWETDTHNKYTAAIIPSTLSTIMKNIHASWQNVIFG